MRWARYRERVNHQPRSTYCAGMGFDQSNMPDDEFGRLLHLIDHDYTPRQTRDAVSEEIYRRAAQIRQARTGKTPEDQCAPVLPRVVSVSEIEVPE